MMKKNNIARLNTEGSLYTSFNPGKRTSAFFNPNDQFISIQNDGKIIIDRQFTSNIGTPRTCFLRINHDQMIVCDKLVVAN